MTSKLAAKRIKLILDLICALIALVHIFVGIYVLKSHDMRDKSVPVSFIVIGVATLVILALGSSAAIFENVCCLITFIVLLVAIILVQIIIVYNLTFDVEASDFTKILDVVWEEELKSPGAMSMYESWLSCCGRASAQDYIVNDRMPPSSCYQKGEVDKIENLFGKSCRLEYEAYWTNLLSIFNILSWILLAFELLGSFVSCYLCNSIRNESRRTYF